MSAPTVAWDLRWRPSGGTGAWKQKRLSVATGIDLAALPRGTGFDAEIRSVAASGKSSAWVPFDFVVGSTNRTGAAALPNIANQQAMWDVNTSVSFASSSDAEGASIATISVSAGTLVIGAQIINYGASSATISGTAEQSITVYLYYDDPDLVGGTRPLGLTQNIVDTANVDGRVAIGSLTFTFPAAGGSSSGGGSIGGGGGSGGACPWIESWVVERDRGLILAGDVLPGDWLLSVDNTWVRVTHSRRAQAPGVRITNSRGHTLTCSSNAPILTTGDAFIAAAELLDERVGAQVDVTGDGPEEIVDVAPLGLIDVQHITCAGAWKARVFLVGDDPRHLFPHHNAKAVQEVAA